MVDPIFNPSPETSDNLPPIGLDAALSGDLAKLKLLAEFSPEINLQQLMDVFGRESRMILMIVLCVLNIVLSPLPGQSAVFGIMLVILSWAVIVDKPLPRLPQKIGGYRFKAEYMIKTLDTIVGYRSKFGKFLRPRRSWLQSFGMKQITNLCFLWLSLVILAPIPFGNTIAAIGIMLMAAGEAERDGNWIIAGWIVAALHIALPVWGMMWIVDRHELVLHW